ncbi:MAG: hypothetical protein JWO84_625 [Parcubacteria group bacterium]|nr:hypothetical protein [Parcubacteria group bacterium]
MILASFGGRRDGHVKGFTLIELLVVIAIIGILSSVVLASLNTARAKGADAAIKSDIDSARAQAELYYDAQTPTSYAAVCTTVGTGIIGMVNGATAAGSASVSCGDSATGWAISAQLKTDTTKYWCADNTGTSTQKTGLTITPGPASADTAC